MNSREKRAVKRIFQTKRGVLMLVIFLAVSVVLYHMGNAKRTIDPDANAEFHFIDVGQGDAAMILTDEVTVLVDCGTGEYSDTLAEYIRQYTDQIDLFVFSHAHDDHMGGAAEIINSFEVSEVLMTEYTSESSFYGRALDAIESRGVTVTEAIAGNTYTSGDVTIEVFSPITDYNDLNNNSIIMRVEADGASALFTGDAEHTAETDVVAKYGYKLSSNILKVGHHGSSTSTSEAFLSAVSPDYAVISCGKNNSYGHPHREIVSLFEKSNFETYRTDTDGTVVFVCRDGGIEVK